MTFTDIKNRVYFLTSANSTDYPIADLTLAANRALEKVVALINQSDMRWQFDDTNQTDLPIATATITSGQQDYSLATTHLTIDRIEVKNTAGNWHVLSQIDQQAFKGEDQIALAEYKETSGIPEEYDILGSSIFLYPTPNFTQAASLKVYFTRGPVAFTTADAAETPGFNTLFHDLIPLYVAKDYAVAKGKKNLPVIYSEIDKLEKSIEKFYQLRNRDFRGRIIPTMESNK